MHRLEQSARCAKKNTAGVSHFRTQNQIFEQLVFYECSKEREKKSIYLAPFSHLTTGSLPHAHSPIHSYRVTTTSLGEITNHIHAIRHINTPKRQHQEQCRVQRLVQGHFSMYTEGVWDQTNTPRLTRATTPPPELHHPHPHTTTTPPPLHADSVWSSAKLAASIIFLLTEQAIKQGPSNSSVLIALFNLREHKWSSPLEPVSGGIPPPVWMPPLIIVLMVKGNRNECAHLALSEHLVFFLLSLGSLQNKVIFF